MSSNLLKVKPQSDFYSQGCVGIANPARQVIELLLTMQIVKFMQQSAFKIL